MPATTDRFSRLAALKPARPAVARVARPALRAPDQEDLLAQFLGAGVVENHFGEHLAIRNWYSTPEYAEPSGVTLELLSRTRDKLVSRNTRATLEDPSRWLFLDTETTGLAGGTGTYAFLIGVAWWDAGGLQVEQFLMRDFSEEHSVLLELAERLAERPVLVTFNGKTFDWPLLESRYLMTRSIRVPQLAVHLDLLHPARALWKLRLGSVKLTELEEHVLDARRLGWDRSDDVPSNMIPQFYFDYLRGRSVAPLAGVVRHNRNDLRGLAALFGRLNTMLSCEKHVDNADGLDLFGLSRYLDRRGERRRAEIACVAARDRGLPIGLDAVARWELAKMAKRRGEYETAVEIWEELLRDADWRAPACEELATFHGRRRKDVPAALRYARQAMFALGKQPPVERLSGAAPRDLRRFERLTRKIERLEAKLRKTNRAPLLEPRR